MEILKNREFRLNRVRVILMRCKRWLFELVVRFVYLPTFRISNRLINGDFEYLNIFCEIAKKDDLLLLFNELIQNKALGVRLIFYLIKGNQIKGIIKYKRAFANKLIAYLRRYSFVSKYSLYDPEIYQFGGIVGWEIAEQHFSGQAKSLLEIFPHRMLSLRICALLTLDLLLRATSDSWEAWDVCVRLEKARGKCPNSGGNEVHGFFEDLFKDEKQYIGLLSKECKDLQSLIDGNSTLIENLGVAGSRKLLDYGLRQILPSYILYLWNNLNIARSDQVAMIQELLSRLNTLKTP